MDPQPSKNKAAIIAVVFLLLLTPISFLAARNFRSQFSRASSTPLSPPGPTNRVFSLTNGYIKVLNSDNINPILTPGFTVETWVKPLATEFYGYLLSKGTSTQNSFALSMSSGPFENTGKFYVSYSFQVASPQYNCGMATITQQRILTAEELQSWQHVAGVVNSTGKLDIFVNGKRSTSNFGSITGTCSLAAPITVGARVLNENSIDGYFNGLIEDTRISQTARYQDNFTPGPITTDGYDLVAYQFEQDPGTIIFSSIGGDHNGQVFTSNAATIIESSHPWEQLYPTSNPLISPTLDPSYISPTAYIPPTYGPTPTYALISPTRSPDYVTPTVHIQPSYGPTPTSAPVVKADTLGVYRSPSNFLLRNTLTEGVANTVFSYGLSGDKPVIGDWDGDGVDTIGVFRTGAFYLRNTNTSGNANTSFLFGSKTDVPVAGDWDGDGKDSVGVFRQGTFYLKNANSSGPTDITLAFGIAGDVPIVGDWNGDGKDTVGVYRPSNSTFYLRNTNTSGNADISFNYGGNGDKPIIGDWNGDKIDTVAVYRNGTYYIRNSNSNGFAQLTIPYGVSTDIPLAGKWTK